MPQIRYYEVSQTRKVKVSANNPTDAVRIADEAFTNGQDANGNITSPDGVWGNTTSRVRVSDVSCYEEI